MKANKKVLDNIQSENNSLREEVRELKNIMKDTDPSKLVPPQMIPVQLSYRKSQFTKQKRVNQKVELEFCDEKNCK